MGVLRSKSHIAVLLFMTWTAWVMCLTLDVADNFWPQRWKCNEKMTWTTKTTVVYFCKDDCLHFQNISQHFQSVLIIVIFSFHSRSRFRPFLGIIASDSRSRILGMFFFHSLPVTEFQECFFFIPFPFLNFENGFFSCPSRSQNLGMDFFIPFLFPNFGNGLLIYCSNDW